MKRLLMLLLVIGALFMAPTASADDGSGMRVPPAGDYGLTAR